MKMKYILTAATLIILALSTTTFAQKVKVKFDREEEITEKGPGMFSAYKESVYAEDAEYIYKRKLVDNSDKTFFLEKIQKSNSHVIWKKELIITPEDKKTKGEYFTLEALEKGFLLIFRKHDIKIKSIVVTVVKLDENLIPISEGKVVHTQKVTKPAYPNIKKVGNHFIIVCDTVPTISSKNTQFLYKVTDLDFNLIWEKRIAPIQSYYYCIEKITLDRELNLVAIYKYRTDGKTIGSTGNTEDYMLLNYNYKKDLVQTKILDFGKYFNIAYGMENRLDTQNNIVEFYGCYAKKQTTGIVGVFNFEYDMTSLQPLTEGTIPFPESILSYYKARPDKEWYPSNLTFRGKIRNQSGTSTFVIECFDKWSKDNAASSPTHYHHEEIFVMNVSTGGKLNWTNMIPRNTSTTEAFADYFMITSFGYNGISYILFNTSMETALNLRKDFGYSIDASGGNTLLLLGYNEKGEQVVLEMITPKENKELWCNIAGIRIANGNLLGITFHTSGANGKVRSKQNAAVEIE